MTDEKATTLGKLPEEMKQSLKPAIIIEELPMAETPKEVQPKPEVTDAEVQTSLDLKKFLTDSERTKTLQ